MSLLLESIGELPAVVEIPIEYDINDDIEMDTRHKTIRFSILAREKLNANDILRHINKAMGPYAVPFKYIQIFKRYDNEFRVVKGDVAWDTIDLDQCYIKFRYPVILLIRMSLQPLSI